MRKIFFISLVVFLFNAVFASAADDKFVVVIDAGHGGKDTGATRSGYKEKDINLNVALALGRLIESNMKNVKVVYTRKSDVFVDLYKRSDIANKAKANLFISIHTNSTASKTTTAEGADTYILGLARSDENLAVAKRENSVILLEDNYNKRYEGFDPNSPESYIIFEFMTDKYMSQSLDFASYVQKGFRNVAKRKDRGVRQAGFLVLRESAMPSVLIELGFINNPSEAKYLSSSVGQRSMASSIYTGLEKYIRDFNKKQGSVGKVFDSPAKKESPVTLVREIVDEPIVEIVEEDTNRVELTQPDSVGDQDISAPQVSTKDKNIKKEPVERGNSAKASKIVSEESVPVVSRTKKQVVTEKNLPAKKETKAEPATKKKIAGVEEYRVQFLISNTKLGSDSPMFKGLSPVQEYKDGGAYKYTYGSTTHESEAIKMRTTVRAKFKDAFIVIFKDGVRIK